MPGPESAPPSPERSASPEEESRLNDVVADLSLKYSELSMSGDEDQLLSLAKEAGIESSEDVKRLVEAFAKKNGDLNVDEIQDVDDPDFVVFLPDTDKPEHRPAQVLFNDLYDRIHERGQADDEAESTKVPTPDETEPIPADKAGINDLIDVAQKGIDALGTITDAAERGARLVKLREDFAEAAAKYPDDPMVALMGRMLGVEKDEPKPDPSEAPTTAMPKLDLAEPKPDEPNPDLGRVGKLWDRVTRRSADKVSEVQQLSERDKAPGESDELKEARDKLAGLRAFERRTAIRHLTPEEMTGAEEAYREAVQADLAKRLSDYRETNPDVPEAILHRWALEILVKEAETRSELEATAIEMRGGRGMKGTNWLRNHTRTRMAVGIALSGAGVALAFTGAGIPIVGAVGVAKVGMRALGGYEAAQGAQEKFTSWRDHSGKRDGERNMNRPKGDMTEAQIDQLMANLMAPSAEIGRSDRKAAVDRKLLTELMKERRDDYDEALKVELESHPDKTLVEKVNIAAAVLIQAELKAERVRLSSDKEVAKKRFRRSAAFAAVLAATPVMVHAVEHVVNHADKVPTSTGGGSLQDSVDSVRHSVGSAAQEIAHGNHDTLAGHFADRDWTVKSGDSQWRIAHKLLSYHQQSFGGMDTQQKLVAIDRLKDLMGGNDLIQPGQHIKVTGAMIKDALNYRN